MSDQLNTYAFPVVSLNQKFDDIQFPAPDSQIQRRHIRVPRITLKTIRFVERRLHMDPPVQIVADIHLGEHLDTL